MRQIARLQEEREALERRIGHLHRRAARLRSPTRKHFRTEGEFAGLWVRTARALEAARFATRAQVRAHYVREGWIGLARIRDVGKYAIAEIEAWLEEPS